MHCVIFYVILGFTNWMAGHAKAEKVFSFRLASPPDTLTRGSAPRPRQSLRPRLPLQVALCARRVVTPHFWPGDAPGLTVACMCVRQWSSTVIRTYRSWRDFSIAPRIWTWPTETSLSLRIAQCELSEVTRLGLGIPDMLKMAISHAGRKHSTSSNRSRALSRVNFRNIGYNNL